MYKRQVFIRALLLTPVSVFVAYLLLLLFKESGGFLSDIGFVLVLPITLIGLGRSIIPSGMFWPTFFVLQLGYVFFIIYFYYYVVIRLGVIKGQGN